MRRLCAIVTLSLISSLALAAPGLAIKDESILAKPSADSAAVGKMTKGMSVDIVARQGGWLQVRTGALQGWVRLLSVRAGAVSANSNELAEVAGAAKALTRKSDPSRVVAVAGVRGFNEEDLKGATFDAAELAKLEGYAVTAAQAKVFAEKAGLRSQAVALLPTPQSEPNAGRRDNP